MSEIHDFWCRIDHLKEELQFRCCKSNDSPVSVHVRNDCREKILQNIENVFENFLFLISRGEAPIFNIPQQNIFGEFRRELKIRFDRCRSVKKFALLCFVLSKIYNLIQTDTRCTKRDLFYQAVDLFKSQSVVDRMVDDIAKWFLVPRNSLHILAASKGLVFGSLTFNDISGNYVDCFLSNQAFQIPADVDKIHNLSSNAKFVLVVEKDATFNKILQTDWTRKMACILVTGKGFPDMSTRLLITRIWNELKIPILILVDADPYGIEIMCVYRFGSLRLAHEVERLVPPFAVRWLGLLPSDVEKLGLNYTCNAVTALNASDKKTVKNLLKRSNCRKFPDIIFQLETLTQQNKKSEIQSLDNLGTHFLTDIYLTNKIRLGGWI